MLIRLWHLLRGRRFDRELDDEMRFHLESLEAEYIASGLSPRDARLAAKRDFGGTLGAQLAHRRQRSLPVLETIGQDIGYAGRVLRRNVGFACVTTLLLAIGIGSSATIFSIVDAVLLKPLPYENADRIVRLLERHPSGATGWFSTPAYLDWKANNTAFEKIAAYQQGLVTLTGVGDPVPLRVGRVTAQYFDVFGVRPFLGRTFADGDDTFGTHQVAVLSHRLWRTRFGSNPGVVGSVITLDNEGYVVIGVLPADTAFDRGTVQIWYPLAFRPSNMTWSYRWLHSTFAVLRPEVSLEQARRQMAAIGERTARENPDTNKGWSIAVDRYADSIVGPQTRTSLLALFVAVGGLLLICCSNLASLMLVRAMSRQGEYALRASLGAGRGRLLQQITIEYLVVTACGAALGIALAVAGLPWLTSLLPPGTFPNEAAIQVDERMLAFAVFVALLTGITCAVVPALHAAAGDPRGVLPDRMRGSTAAPARARLLNALVVGEVAIAFVLLSGSALLIRSSVALTTVDTGFVSENVLTMSLPVPGFPPGSAYRSSDEFTAYLRELVAAVETIPGVQRAAVTNALPLTDCCLYGLAMQVVNRPVVDRATRAGGGFKVVTPSYFETLGLTLRSGRFLDERDTANSVPAIVINQRLADREFPGEDPIGRRILNPRIIPGMTERGADIAWEIVGVVANEKVSALNDDLSAVVYASYEQSPVYFANLTVRSGLATEATEAAVRQAVQRVNKSQAIMDVRTLDQLKVSSMASGRLQTVLITTFSTVALLLAAIGMYGVLAYSVALRVREIGIRTALGASSATLLRAVLMQGGLVTGLGLLVGVTAALVLTPLLSSVLYRVEAHAPYLMAAALMILVLVSLAACLIPARRAARVDPIVALRAG